MTPTRPHRTLTFDPAHTIDPSLEWIVTNGIGGYASGPVAGGVSRRFHGTLIASLSAPLGRQVCLNFLGVTVIDGGRVSVLDDARPSAEATRARLVDFALEHGLPRWRYDAGGVILEKRIVMPYGRNTTHVLVRQVDGQRPVTLRIAPAFQVRPHEGVVTAPALPPKALRRVGDAEVELSIDDTRPVIRWRVWADHVAWSLNRPETFDVDYPIERARGYDWHGPLWTPGGIDVGLEPGGAAAFTVSTESREMVAAIDPNGAYDAEVARRDLLLTTARVNGDVVAETLTLAADQFLVTPMTRVDEVARARAAGDEPRSVIAGYHWFTDWGRDTMISLEGLTLATGRTREAGCLLRTFARYIRDGLIPNMFPEGANQGLYHTADATLWFFHALERYVRASNDHATLTALLPALVDVADHHVRGTRFGIGVDPKDGLLRQGADGYQLTWMDAKVGDWVVTPRRGKAVEINALWFNAVCLLSSWLTAAGHDADAQKWRAVADRTAASFNARFWNPATGFLFDVVDGEHGDDPACRPNQVFAIALDHPVLSPERWAPVLDVVRRTLLTPRGLRTLSPDHPDFKPTYDGDLKLRDAAYHQGTVWAWLIGPFVDAWRRTYPDDLAEPRAFLDGLVEELDGSGVGTISEIFDAEPPYTPRGCIAQAWSVAEVLRVWRGLGSARSPIAKPEPDREAGEQLRGLDRRAG
jgi:predicted glycogen debranching enzyme